MSKCSKFYTEMQIYVHLCGQRKKLLALKLCVREASELLWVGRTNHSFITSCLHNSQINYMYTLAACFHKQMMVSEVMFSPGMIWYTQKTSSERAFSGCSMSSMILLIACDLSSMKLSAAPVQSFIPLSTAHLTQGKIIMGFLLFFCFKLRKSWQSSFKALNTYSIIPYYNSASIAETILQESLLLSKDVISQARWWAFWLS